MDLNTAWFILVGVLLTGYAILDGFDLGVGVWHLFARDDKARRAYMRAIGPVWDGNEVWLLTAGGALFAAFPIVYATVFSGFYLALMLLLTALIFRAVSLELRGKVASPRWTRAWDWGFGLGSLVAVVLLGVALGNILRGVPIDETGAFTGSFLGLLNPYALFMGVVTLLLLTMHGAAYLTAKTDGELAARMRTSVSGVWAAFIVAYVVLACVTPFAAPFLFDGLLKKPLFWVFFAAQLAGLVCVPVSARAGRGLPVFLASSVVIAGLAGLVAVGLFPRLTPSSTNLAYSLTIYNAASTPRTQTVMLVIALMGMPLVVAYTAFVYWVFRGKATGEESY